MKTIFTLLSGAFATASAFADPIIPTTDGMTWEYTLTQEAGEGYTFSDLKPDEDGGKLDYRRSIASMERRRSTAKIY